MIRIKINRRIKYAIKKSNGKIVNGISAGKWY